MNYQVFKSMLDVLVKTYKCPFCQADVGENNIEIIGAAGTTMNIDVACPSCSKHSIVKAEVAHIDAKMMNFNQNSSLEDIKSNLSSILRKNIEMDENKKINFIKDKDIISLSHDLQSKDIKIEDLFN